MCALHITKEGETKSMDSYLQNSNGTSNNPYTPGGYERAKLRKLLLIVVGVLAAIAIIALVVHFVRPESQQSKYIKSATAAARKGTPNAKVTNVKVADGFALATVSGPTTNGPENIVYTAVFKVNQDGSMTQIANGSSFSPIDLLGLGIPLATQAKLTEHNLTQTQQDLASTCGYSGGNAPGYIGFNGSFNPGGWQIDAATLDGSEQALTAAISNKNAAAKDGEKVICVKATREKSNFSTDKQTYISTFTLELQLITGNGTVTTHTFTFAVGPNYYRSYTLDGQKIQNR
jgi:hypothetical protein